MDKTSTIMDTICGTLWTSIQPQLSPDVVKRETAFLEACKQLTDSQYTGTPEGKCLGAIIDDPISPAELAKVIPCLSATDFVKKWLPAKGGMAPQSPPDLGKPEHQQEPRPTETRPAENQQEPPPTQPKTEEPQIALEPPPVLNNTPQVTECVTLAKKQYPLEKNNKRKPNNQKAFDKLEERCERMVVEQCKPFQAMNNLACREKAPVLCGDKIIKDTKEKGDTLKACVSTDKFYTATTNRAAELNLVIKNVETRLVKNACDAFAQNAEPLNAQQTQTIQEQRAALNTACVELAPEHCRSLLDSALTDNDPAAIDAINKCPGKYREFRERAEAIFAAQAPAQTEPEKQPEQLLPDQDLTKTVPQPQTDFSDAFNKWHMYASLGFGGNFIGGLSVDGETPALKASSLAVRAAIGFLLKPLALGHDSLGSEWMFRVNVGGAFEDNVHFREGDYVYNTFGLGLRGLPEFVVQLPGWRLILAVPEVALYFGGLTTDDAVDVGLPTKLYETSPAAFVFRIQVGAAVGAEIPTLFSASEAVVPFVMIGGAVNIWFKSADINNPPSDRPDIDTAPKRATGDIHLDFGVHF